MGTWYQTCMLTNMPILDGEEIVSFIIAARHPAESPVNNGPDSFWAPIPFPLYGRYVDAGRIDYEQSIFHQDAINFVNDSGVREYDNLDEIKADAENGRLTIDDDSGQRQGAMVHVKRSFFDAILREFTITRVVSPAYRAAYTSVDTYHSVTSDIEADSDRFLPAIDDFQNMMPNMPTRLAVAVVAQDGPRSFSYFLTGDPEIDCCLPTDPVDFLRQCTPSEQRMFAEEMVKLRFITEFMRQTRKAWAPTVGYGSQEMAGSAYSLLANYLISETPDV